MNKSPRRGENQTTKLTKEKIFAGSNVARDSFQKLVSKHVDEAELAEFLCVIPTLPTELAPLAPGKTDKTTKNFASRINSLAEEIEAINSKGWLLYDLSLDAWSEANPRTIEPEGVGPAEVQQRRVMGESDQRTLDDFRKLPRRLRASAAYMKSVIQHRRPRDHFQKFAVIKLLEMVRRATGTFYFADARDLCDAAFQAAGCPVPGYLKNLQSFAKFYGNNPRLHAPPDKSTTGNKPTPAELSETN